jgi:hypothetical protein
METARSHGRELVEVEHSELGRKRKVAALKKANDENNAYRKYEDHCKHKMLLPFWLLSTLPCYRAR